MNNINQQLLDLDRERTILAIERAMAENEITKFARTRTFLAFIRTGLTFIGLAIAVINLYPKNKNILYTGYALLIIGIIFIGVSFVYT